MRRILNFALFIPGRLLSIFVRVGGRVWGGIRGGLRSGDASVFRYMLTLLVCLFLHLLWLCLFLIGKVGVGVITVVVFGLFLDIFELLAHIRLRHSIPVFSSYFRLLCGWLSFLGLFFNLFLSLLLFSLLLNLGLHSFVFFDLCFDFADGLSFFLLNIWLFSILCLGLFDLGLFSLGRFFSLLSHWFLNFFSLGLFSRLG